MFRRAILITSVGLALSLFTGSAVHAATFKSEATITVPATETIDGTLFATGTDITVHGLVRGDIMCAGQNITLAGRVEGDVLCAGNNITITGVVQGDVRVAANRVEVASQVNGSVTALAQKTVLTPMARVGRDLVVAGETINIEALTGRDVIATGTALAINNVVGRHVTFWGDNLQLRQAAGVAGDLHYTSGQKATIDPAATVIGDTKHTPQTATPSATQTLMGNVLFGAYWFVAMVVFGGFVVLMKPRFLQATATHAHAKPWATLGWGLVGLIGVPLVALIFMLTIVGMPLSIFMLLMWVASLLLAQLLAAHAFGAWLLQKMNITRPLRQQQFLAVLLGLLALTLLGIVPIVGGLVGFLALLFGLGSFAAFFKPKQKPAKNGDI